MTETITGTDRSAGISYAELLDRDSHPVTDVFRKESPMPPGNTRVPAAVYYDRAWHDLEVERLWKRSWQMACLEDDIPEVGDYHVYDIASLSFLIVRTAPDEIKAYANACLHRGRKLRERDGKGAKALRCAFHGWCWNTDGSLREIPCEWDFPEVDQDHYDLPEAACDTWDGFVFINPDRDAEPLENFMGDFADHFTHLPFRKRWKAVHVRKLMPMNWKVCQEAFMEAYHTVATHPTLLENLGDANSRYDVYENYSRAISPAGVDSPHLAGKRRWERLEDGKHYARWRHPMNGHIYERVEEGVVHVTDLDGNVSVFDDDATWKSGPITQADPHLCKWIGGKLVPGMEDEPLMLPNPPSDIADDPGKKRAWMAEPRRQQLKDEWGELIDVDQVSDAELLDAIWYTVFPNWHPWGCFQAINYRFRPNGDDPETSIFEVMFFLPFPDESQKPPPAEPFDLGLDDDWTAAPQLGMLSKVFQQDALNLPWVQKGLKAQEQQEVVFASYNESKIRHFYEMYFDLLGVDSTVDIRSGNRA